MMEILQTLVFSILLGYHRTKYGREGKMLCTPFSEKENS